VWTGTPGLYHMRFGHCRFGSDCSYLHVSSTPETSTNTVKTLENEILKLKETLGKVVAALENNEIETKVHEQRIFCLESKSEACVDKFKCTQCEYQAVSCTALKSHVTKKHKVEVLRESSSDKELNVSLQSKDRDSPSPKPNTEIPEFGWEPNTCGLCSETFTKTDHFKDHMVEYHGLLYVEYDCTLGCFDCGDIFEEPFEQWFGQYTIGRGQIHSFCKYCLADTI
jgi:hypothetical protein